MEDHSVFYTADSLNAHLQSKGNDLKIGLVPTMGALHHGHLSLVSSAMEMTDIVVVSIFVNPTQFNRSEDLEKYPRTLENDVALLKTIGKIVVFAPSVDEVYPSDYEPISFDLGPLGNVMEGKYREGHFDGVMNVVKRFFDIISPNFAYFGLKDYQQFVVIQQMTKHFKLDVEIIPCEIVREETGLARSSRNVRLSEQLKKDALVIIESLRRAKTKVQANTPAEVKEMVVKVFEGTDLELEYFEIVDPNTLMSIDDWIPGSHACIAAFCGGVKLLDNMQMVEFV